jgi:alkylation response protein AidB-like acyl-CoA dehydrogenase
MQFAFSDEQRLFQKTMRELLARQCPPARVRAAWSGDSGRSPELWRALAENGIVGVTVPADWGGLGGDELDWVLLLEEAGAAALPEPLAETMAIGVPLLARAAPAELAERWLRRVAVGEARLTVGFLDAQPFVLDAHVADLLLLRHEEAIYAVERAAVRLQVQHSVDRSRRLYRVAWEPSAATLLAAGDVARPMLSDAFDRGALAAAAQLLGLAHKLISVTVDYVQVRRQFGQPVGSFQAVKHHLVDALVKLEFARPLAYRAANSLARGEDAERSAHVSMAKAAASEAALKAARVALQCHGAIGYSFEHDLHLWMKRAWALAVAWGDAAWHRARVGATILDQGGQSARHGLGGDDAVGSAHLVGGGDHG